MFRGIGSRLAASLKRIPGRFTVTDGVALVAMFVLLGGVSYAAVKIPKNSVGTKQLKKNAVTSAKVKNRSLLAVDFKKGQLPMGAAGPTGSQGERGVQGPPGTTGPRGLEGPPGAVGPTGPAGAASMTGATGPTGPAGSTGPTGPAGPTGAPGATGAAGIDGEDGSTGPTGVTGPTGPEGELGPAGPTGVQGPTGTTGPTGSTGATGATGPAGEDGLNGFTIMSGKTSLGSTSQYFAISGFSTAGGSRGPLEMLLAGGGDLIVSNLQVVLRNSPGLVQDQREFRLMVGGTPVLQCTKLGPQSGCANSGSATVSSVGPIIMSYLNAVSGTPAATDALASFRVAPAP